MTSTMPAAEGDASNITEHMTRLQMRLQQQKLDNAKTQQRLPEESGKALDPNKVRYHQSWLKRQELLERLKAANGPDLPDLRPQSLPELGGKNQRLTSPNTARESAHLVGEARRKSYSPNHDERQPYQKSPPWYHQPTWLPPHSYQPPILYNQYPIIGTTAVVPMATQQQQQPQQSNKSDYFDMMLVQNAQMHQLFMQQLLTRGLSSKDEPQTVVIEQPPAQAPPPQPQVITLPSNKRPKSRHHHHYTQLPPLPQEKPYQIHHVQHIEQRKASPKRQKTPERRPNSPPQVSPRWRPPPPLPIAVRELTPKPVYPASDALRKLRHIAYAAWFVSFLKIAARKRKEEDKFLFGIRLKEAIGALHKIYLNPDGNIYPLIRDVISPGTRDLTEAFNAGQNRSLQELVYFLENVIYQMSDIMPNAGVLGTHRKAVVFEMLLEGKIYPEGYFWEMEKRLLTFDEERRTTQLNNEKRRVLLLGMFLTRGLITTLLMKPLDYGVSTTLLDEVAEENLRLLASILIYSLRKATVPPTAALPPAPTEVSNYLYTDNELRPLLDKINPTLEYIDELLRNWLKEYIKRLQSFIDRPR